MNTDRGLNFFAIFIAFSLGMFFFSCVDSYKTERKYCSFMCDKMYNQTGSYMDDSCYCYDESTKTYKLIDESLSYETMMYKTK